MGAFSRFFKSLPQPSEKQDQARMPSGWSVTDDGVWHTGILRVQQHGEDFDISLVDQSLVNAFRARFPGTGEALSGNEALIIAHVFAALDAALDAWRSAEPNAWPESAGRELRALSRICSRLGGNAGSISFFYDPKHIRNAAVSFVDVLRNHPGIRPKFGSGLFTVYNVTMKFGNALGCGGAVMTAANVYG